MRRLNWKTAAFWAATGVFAGTMLLSAAMYLSGGETIRAGMAHLGYPSYVLIILGTAKAIGVLALVQSRAILREWAYAGFTINLIGASASHGFAGDGVGAAMVPAVFLVVLAVSYAFRPDKKEVPANVPVDAEPRLSSRWTSA